MGNKSVKKKKPSQGIKLTIYLSHDCMTSGTFPKINLEDAPVSDYDGVIESAGRKFMTTLLDRCSGSFIMGMRKVLQERCRITTYGTSMDITNDSN